VSGPTVVTGANGFAGRHLTAALHSQHTPDVIGWHRQPPRDVRIGCVRLVDILDRDAVRRAIADDQPRQIFHLAGAPHVGNSWRDALSTLQVNVLGTHHLLDAIRLEAPRCRALIVTSGMIYLAGAEALTEDAPLVPSNPYGVSKLAQDQLARIAAEQDNIDVVVARPFNHFGPGQDPSFALSSFARQVALIEAGVLPPVLRVGNLDSRRDLTDVRDVVSAYLRIMEVAPPGTTLNVCSGRAHRIGDLLDGLLRLARVPITTTPDPDRMRPSDVPVLLGCQTRLARSIGWTPQTPIDVTLSDTLTWWRSEVAAGRGRV
jgi:GDP-4-dehydro-6-deoxy-D-mannose reductase